MKDSKLEQVEQLPTWPDRPLDGHKGTFGTVIVVGGCPTMLGAPALTAGAALRAGAGLVKVFASPTILPYILTIEPCATGIDAGDAFDQSITHLQEADPEHKAVLAIGPGLGKCHWAKQMVSHLATLDRKMVLDADALNILSQSQLPQAKRRPASKMALPLKVLTPHVGEYRRLAEPLGLKSDPIDPSQKPTAVAELARAYHAVVVLKGASTIVADAGRYFVNTMPNPAMATAGSGDVLTGIITALMAQGLTAWDAAVLGVHLHSLAGEQWLKLQGPVGMTAMDLMKLVPKALNQGKNE